MGFPRQEYWNGLPFPTPGDLPEPVVEPKSLELQADSLLLSHQERYICSVHLLSCVWLFANPWTAEYKAFLSITNSRACSNSCPSSWWCHPTISPSVVPFSSCLQSFPASGSFPMSQFFTSDGQIIGVSASASVFPMNIQDWFTLGVTDLISLLSKGLSRVFSNATVQKHQFFVAQLSLWSNSHIHSWLPEKPYLWLDGPLSAK